MRRYELSDTQWDQIEDLFPSSPHSRGRPRREDRLLLHAIFWILCSGAAWRDLPEQYGPWQTAYDRFRQWKQERLFDQILERLHIQLDEEGLINYATWMMDATIIHASKAAAGARKKKNDAVADQALGRSRGGFTTKLHLVCDQQGIPLAMCVTAGQVQEATQVEALMTQIHLPQRRGRPRCRPQHIIADKGYDAQWIRQYLRRRGIRPEIPNRATPTGRQRRQRGPRPRYDRTLYKQRNVIERLFGWLKEHRRIATRFEKKASHFMAMIKLACIRRVFQSYFLDTP